MIAQKIDNRHLMSTMILLSHFLTDFDPPTTYGLVGLFTSELEDFILGATIVRGIFGVFFQL